MTTRLRLSFVGVALAVLVAVGLLLHSALAGIDEQRRLRHRVVAERVFDEVERELGSLLEHEAKRPSSAYDATETAVSRWSAFIVGYYKRDGDALALVAEPQLGRARAARLRRAVEHARVRVPTSRSAHSATDQPATRPRAISDPEPLAERTRHSSPEVLRQLNRSIKVRQQRLGLASAFVVVPVDVDMLVIERSADDDSRREGFVVDTFELVRALQRWVIDSQGLGGVASLSPSPRAGYASAGGYAFEHRLAAPLQSHTLHLSLARLDDEDAGSALLGLGALLSTSLILGLIALYRMVAVQVRFAERRNNFVSAVTHELRTPLTAIRMYAEMLREGMVEGERERSEYYGIITSEAERLTRLINNVLEHAQLQKGQRPMHLSPADLGLIVDEVTEVMAPHIERQGFRVQVERRPGLPRAMADPDALKQVLFNVLDNALKYGRSASTAAVDVRVSADGDTVTLAIRDHGPGLSEARMHHIFEPFYRGQDELTRKQQGTGIGLSLVKDLVERMHGRVRGVNAEPGLEIRVELPRAQRAQSGQRGAHPTR